MSDSTIPLNPGTGGKALDSETLTGAGGAAVERARQQIAGKLLAAIADVLNAPPAGTEYALVVRPIPSGTQTVSGSVSVSNTVTVQGTVTVTDGSGPVTVDGTVAVSSSALPTGAATESTLTAINGKLPASPSQEHTAASSPHAARLSDGAAFYDARQIRALTTADLVTATLGTAAGKTNVLRTGTITTTAATADQVVHTYTVTSGRTLYLEYVEISAVLTALSATASILGTASLETPSGTKVITERFQNMTISKPDRLFLTFPEPIPIAAGVVIRVVCTPPGAASTVWRANFGGYER